MMNWTIIIFGKYLYKTVVDNNNNNNNNNRSIFSRIIEFLSS